MPWAAPTMMRRLRLRWRAPVEHDPRAGEEVDAYRSQVGVVPEHARAEASDALLLRRHAGEREDLNAECGHALARVELHAVRLLFERDRDGDGRHGCAIDRPVVRRAAPTPRRLFT